MKIVADANIPFAEEAFGSLGQVTLLPGRAIGPEQVRDADVLIVRSVTPVGPALLEGSRVRFVGSATIGLDHVDEPYLHTRGIAFAYAPGSNANSVAEYVIAALLALGRERYEGRILGIIGVGRIGTLVQEKALALGMTVLANDPPLERAGRAGLVSLEELLCNSDIVTCHVPLTREGPDATFHLLDEARLVLLQPHAAVINTARGAVVDNAALLRALRGGRLGGAVLDVWEHEPEPDPALVEAVTLGTPHIAGYSFDGKVNGTKMLYDAVCAFLGRGRDRGFPNVPSEGNAPPVEIEADASLDGILRSLVGKAYDIRRDDAALRASLKLPQPERARAFDLLRAEYPRRLEFRHTRVVLPPNLSRLRKALSGLGFATEEML